ncbi:MAG: hypothetical protein ABR985_22670, partial [Methanotrichaceae archaeon]
AHLVVLTFVIMILNWIQEDFSRPSFFSGTLTRLLGSISADAQFVLMSESNSRAITNYLLEYIIHAGFYIFLLFFIIEFLIFVRNIRIKQTHAEGKFILIAIVLIMMTYIFIFFSLKNILPDRWYLFFNAPLILVGTSGMFNIASIISKKIYVPYLAIFLVIIILLPIVASPEANNDSPVVFNNVCRDGYTQSELTAVRTLSQIGAGYPITDLYYGDIIPFIIGKDKYKKMIANNKGIFILRNFYINHPLWDRNYTIPINLGNENDNYTKNSMNVYDFMNNQGILASDLIYNDKVKVYCFSGYKNLLE